jgi:hypothetical protein
MTSTLRDDRERGARAVETFFRAVDFLVLRAISLLPLVIVRLGLDSGSPFGRPE